MILQPIVEGQGDEAAVPVLLRRLAEKAAAWDLQIARPHRRRRTQLVRKDTLQAAVRTARLTQGCGAILVVFDADDDCPAELAPQLSKWAREAAGATPCALVMANREYEAWLLAGIRSLRGVAGIRSDAGQPLDPETPRDAKGKLEDHMGAGANYMPTADQARMTAAFDLASAFQLSRSFRKLVVAFGEMLTATGRPPDEWPPAGWLPSQDALGGARATTSGEG